MLCSVSVLGSFLWLNNISLCVYTTICLSIHLLFGVWDVFTFSYFEQCCYKHACACICLSTSFQFFWAYTQKNCWVIANLWLTFWRTAKLVPQERHHFTFPPAMYESASFSTSCQHLLFSTLKKKQTNCSLPSGCEVVSHCGFDFHFPSN